jgi:hypothetical protein
MNAVLGSESNWFKQITNMHPGKFCTGLVLLISLISGSAIAGPREQAKRIHDRLAGVPPTESVLNTMEAQIAGGNAEAAAFTAMDHTAFYDVTLKNMVMPWSNEEQTAFAPLNDYVATVIGIIRDEIDFREILSGDIIYVGNSSLGLSAYSNSNNNHYEELENQHISLKDNLVQQAQSSVTGLPANATAGVMTTRGGSRAFFIDGTNRAMFRFTMINQLCTDLEQIQDNSRAYDRIRQDVSRSPGGDSRIFMNQCASCHTGMDGLTGALAFYDYDYPEGNMDGGATVYNDVGETDATTGTRVDKKYRQNSSVFKFGYQTTDDSWVNYWRVGLNQNMGWDPALPGSGNGASSMGQELAHTEMFASCQVKKVFNNVCLRDPVDGNDRAQVTSMIASFKASSYNLKQVFAESAAYCMGQ